MSTFIDRLKTERKDLNAKTVGLQTFFDQGKHRAIQENQSDLLSIQLDAMKVYLKILDLRISTL